MGSNVQFDDRRTPKLPYSDFRPKIKEYIKSLWKEEWKSETENKLFKIRPNLKQRTSSHLSRRENVIITRLEIGHSKLTHQHLTLGEEPPFCIGCNCQLTIKHILIECIEYSEIRSKY